MRVEGTHKNDRLDPLSKLVKLTNNDGEMTVGRKSVCYSLRGVMEIPCHRPHPKTNALIDCIYHKPSTLLPRSYPLSHPPLVYATAIQLRHISALYDAFGRFSPVLAYFALHLFRTG